MSVNIIDGVDASVMVAINVPGGECSKNDPDQRRSAWSMAFPDGASEQQLRAAICAVGDLSAAQRLADGCHLEEDLLACATGPGFPPEVLDDLAIFPQPTEHFGADIEAILGVDNPEDLIGWHDIVEEQTSVGDYIQLLLRRDPASGDLQYLLDGGEEAFGAPRRCDPEPVS